MNGLENRCGDGVSYTSEGVAGCTFSVFAISFALTYCILMGIAIIQLFITFVEYGFRIYDKRGYVDGTLLFRMTFFLFSILCCLLSAVNYAVYHEIVLTSNQNPIEIILGGMPGYLYISLSFLMVTFWMYIVFSDATMKSKYWIIRKAFSMPGLLFDFLLFSLVQYFILTAIYVILIVGFYLYPEQTIIKIVLHYVEATYAALLCIVVILAAIIFGILMLRLVRKLKKEVHFNSWKHNLKYGGVSAVAATMFSFRAIIILIQLLIPETTLWVFLILTLVSEIACKFIPTIILFTMFGRYTWKIRGKGIQITAPKEEEKEEWNYYNMSDDEYYVDEVDAIENVNADGNLN